MNDANQTRAPIRIDFVSDVSCPWCAIGLAALEQALERTRGEIEAEIHVQPFELNPQMPSAGEATAEHLAKKYGLSGAQLAENQERIRARGAELGFTFGLGKRRRIYNTFDAHRLLHWAGSEGKQLDLKHALLGAYFTDGLDVSDSETLVNVASGLGLPAERARENLASDEFAAEVRAAEQHFQRQGIQAVPAVILNGRHLISGGQPVEVFEQALRQMAADLAD